MSIPDTNDLGGLSVLVTRPRQQATRLCEMIEAAHGRPIRFPAMAIEPALDADACRAILRRQADLLIFTSANAVEFAFPLLPDALPIDLQIAAVGNATAARLRDIGLEPTLVPPDRQDSEGLLALPELQHPAGRKILIIRGVGGRPLLGDTLKQRGAEITYAEVYRRTLPQQSPRNLLAGWERMVDAVIVTSNEILDNLLLLLGKEGREKLCRTPLVVISQRLADHAAELGCRDLLLADGAGDAALLTALGTLAKRPG